MGRKILNTVFFVLLLAFAAAFIFPVAVVLINSFKTKFSITESPFTLPLGSYFVGIINYTEGIRSTGFPSAFGWSLFITVFFLIEPLPLAARPIVFLRGINNLLPPRRTYHKNMIRPEWHLVNYQPSAKTVAEHLSVLGFDVRCGCF